MGKVVSCQSSLLEVERGKAWRREGKRNASRSGILFRELYISYGERERGIVGFSLCMAEKTLRVLVTQVFLPMSRIVLLSHWEEDRKKSHLSYIDI